MNYRTLKPVITAADVEKIKNRIKIGDKLTYTTAYIDGDDGKKKFERKKVVVTAKYPHFVQAVNPEKPWLTRSLTYEEVFMQKHKPKGREK